MFKLLLFVLYAQRNNYSININNGSVFTSLGGNTPLPIGNKVESRIIIDVTSKAN